MTAELAIGPDVEVRLEETGKGGEMVLTLGETVVKPPLTVGGGSRVTLVGSRVKLELSSGITMEVELEFREPGAFVAVETAWRELPPPLTEPETVLFVGNGGTRVGDVPVTVGETVGADAPVEFEGIADEPETEIERLVMEMVTSEAPDNVVVELIGYGGVEVSDNVVVTPEDPVVVGMGTIVGDPEPLCVDTEFELSTADELISVKEVLLSVVLEFAKVGIAELDDEDALVATLENCGGGQPSGLNVTSELGGEIDGEPLAVELAMVVVAFVMTGEIVSEIDDDFPGPEVTDTLIVVPLVTAGDSVSEAPEDCPGPEEISPLVVVGEATDVVTDPVGELPGVIDTVFEVEGRVEDRVIDIVDVDKADELFENDAEEVESETAEVLNVNAEDTPGDGTPVTVDIDF